MTELNRKMIESHGVEGAQARSIQSGAHRFGWGARSRWLDPGSVSTHVGQAGACLAQSPGLDT
jgi:hypothetical protein